MQLLTPGLGLIIWTLLAFLVVFFILKKFAWPSILGGLRKREQCPIALRSTHDLKPNRKSLVIEAHWNRDGRKAQHVHEPREAAQRVERGG